MNPPDCDPEVFAWGKVVALVYAPSHVVEPWVRAVAARSDARVDWRPSAGMGVVLHLGDAASRARVEAAVDELEAALDGWIVERTVP